MENTFDKPIQFLDFFTGTTLFKNTPVLLTKNENILSIQKCLIKHFHVCRTATLLSSILPKLQIRVAFNAFPVAGGSLLIFAKPNPRRVKKDLKEL